MKRNLSLFLLIFIFFYSYAQDIAYNDVAFSNTYVKEKRPLLPNKTDEELSTMLLKERFAKLQSISEVNISFNGIIERSVATYLSEQRNDIANLMDKSRLYFPIFEDYLTKYELPDEIKYLAIVESRLEPDANSYMGAKGLWQFMYGTGLAYGLKINAKVDQRLDAIKATEAACKYLKDLYNMFGDWNLALAAYNSGPGNVRKAIHRSGGYTDFWKIRNYLPKETRDYVPSFYSVFYMFEYGEDHGIYPKNNMLSYEDVQIVEVKNDLSFNEINERFQIDHEFMTALNPQYKQGIITYQDQEETYIILPKSALRAIVPCVSEPYELAVRLTERSAFFLGSIKKKGDRKCYGENNASSYTVQEGDSLWLISKKYPNITINQIRSWNNLWNVNYLAPGTQLKILTK